VTATESARRYVVVNRDGWTFVVREDGGLEVEAPASGEGRPLIRLSEDELDAVLSQFEVDEG